MLRILFFVLLFIVTSCRPSQKDYTESFDIPLIKQNERFQLSGEYDSLIQLNKKYYQLADNMGYEDGKALCYINLANTNMWIGNYPRSRSFFEHAKEIIDQSESTIHKALFYTNYGQFKIYFKYYEKNDEYNSLALNYAKKSKDSWLKNYVFSKIYRREGNFFLVKKQYNRALESYRKSKKYWDSIGSDISIGNFYLNYGGNLDSVQIYLSRALEYYNKHKEKKYMAASAYITMGEYYIKIKKYDEAEKMYLKALEIDTTTRRTYGYLTKYIYDELRKLYEEKHDKEKAYFYLKAFLNAKKGMNASLLSAVNQDMDEFIFEADRNAQKEKNKMMTLILIGFAVFAFSGIYSWQVIDFLKQKKINLKNEAEELKSRMDNTVGEKAIKLAQTNDPSFLQVFREAYPGFTEKVLKINPDLEESELVFCAMLKLHFSSKEVALYTSVQHRTVQQKKYRIRKKLNIPQDTDTYLFFDHLLSSNY